MKKLLLSAMVIAMALVSCNKSKDVEPTVKKGTPFETKFAISGIVLEGIPMTKTGPSSSDLVAIQIKELDGMNSKMIAGGLFVGDYGFDNLSVTMKHGYEYVITATVVKNGTGVGYEDVESVRKYGAPFISQVGTEMSITEEKTAITMNPSDFTEKVVTFRDLAAQADGDSDYLPTTGLVPGDRWYFKKTITADYDQASDDYDNKKIKLDFKRVSFKVTYAVSNLDGNQFKCNPFKNNSGVTWKLVDGDAVIIYTCWDIPTVYSDLTAAQNYRIDLGVNLPDQEASIKWERQDLNVKPNYQYTITYDASVSADNNFSITLDDVWQSE